MADNVQLNAGAGGAIAASDDIGGVQYQRVKLTLGADGTSDGDASLANPIPVRPAAGTATLANVGQSATNVTLASSLTSRIGMVIHNDSTANLLIKYGATASATSYTYKVRPDGVYEMPYSIVFTGQIDGIWDAAGAGNARVTELSI